jgi:hypothetical protein
MCVVRAPAPYQWYMSANIQGGTVSGNTISGAAILVNVDGGGTAAAPIQLQANTYGEFVPDLTFLCGKTCPGSQLNISPDSVVNRGGDNNPVATSFAWNQCP